MTEDHSIDVATALERTEKAGVSVGGYTMRMTCTENIFRDPKNLVHRSVRELFAETFDDHQFKVIEVEGKGTYAVFDGYRLMPPDQIQAHVEVFDEALTSILMGEDGSDRPEVGLNMGFLAEQSEHSGHVHGPDCDH